MSPVYLLLLPALVYGKLIIDIDITDINNPLLDARMQGERTSVITDTERGAFKIGDEQLKIAIAKATNGTQPNNVSIKTTGKGLDLHKKYKWDDVKRTIKTILTFKNKCDHETNDIQKSDDVVESIWKLQGNISIDMEYDIYVHDESLNFNISSPFGRNFKNSIEYHFDKVVKAQKCNVDIEISYYTTLSGRVAANYAAKRKDHYHWGYDVNYILKGAKLPTEVVNNQTISITYFKESTIVK